MPTVKKVAEAIQHTYFKFHQDTGDIMVRTRKVH